MSVKLLTEHHLEFISLTGGCTYSCQNATLLEITCHSSLAIVTFFIKVKSFFLCSGNCIHSTVRHFPAYFSANIMNQNYSHNNSYFERTLCHKFLKFLHHNAGMVHRSWSMSSKTKIMLFTYVKPQCIDTKNMWYPTLILLWRISPDHYQGSYRKVWVKFKDFSRTSKDYLTVFKD